LTGHAAHAIVLTRTKGLTRMKVSQLIAQLQALQEQHVDLEVMFQNDDAVTWEIMVATTHLAREDEFPKEWNMPKGFEFIKLSN
jgi:hypothetical protein